MANVDSRGGLVPLDSPFGAVRTTRYTMTASSASNMFVGDAVVLASTGYIVHATLTASNAVLGAVVGIESAADGPIKYFVGGTAGVHYVDVADDPAQRFVCQEDDGGTALTVAAIGAGVNLLETHGGNTTTGRSGQEFDRSDIAQSQGMQLRLLGLVNTPDNAYGDNAKWIAKIDYHQLETTKVATPV